MITIGFVLNWFKVNKCSGYKETLGSQTKHTYNVRGREVEIISTSNIIQIEEESFSVNSTDGDEIKRLLGVLKSITG